MQGPPEVIDLAFPQRAVPAVKALLASGVSRSEILTRLAGAAENLSGPGSAVSILVLDGDGLLRNGASPKLPADYLAAIDRLRPNAAVGTCAAAAATGMVVVTPDFSADEKWAELRHLPAALGYRFAWSFPIKNASGRVLGTFGTYFQERRSPTEAERDAIGSLAEAAALALE